MGQHEGRGYGPNRSAELWRGFTKGQKTRQEGPSPAEKKLLAENRDLKRQLERGADREQSKVERYLAAKELLKDHEELASRLDLEADLARKEKLESKTPAQQAKFLGQKVAAKKSQLERLREANERHKKQAEEAQAKWVQGQEQEASLLADIAKMEQDVAVAKEKCDPLVKELVTGGSKAYYEKEGAALQAVRAELARLQNALETDKALQQQSADDAPDATAAVEPVDDDDKEMADAPCEQEVERVIESMGLSFEAGEEGEKKKKQALEGVKKGITRARQEAKLATASHKNKFAKKGGSGG